MIGNAAAALQGAPVTTLDFDFMFRKTQRNLNKLKCLAKELDGYILKPFYPLSGLYRVVNDDLGLQLDFLSSIHGVKSFESLRSRATIVHFQDSGIMVADLSDIINSKKKLARARDMAVMEILEETLNEKKQQQSKSTLSAEKGK